MPSSVRIADLLPRLPASTLVVGDRQRAVTSLVVDSRRVVIGALFVALRGEHVDGHAFVEQALARGAASILVEVGTSLPQRPGVTYLYVPNARRALSALAAAFYGDPSQHLDVIGITGTNGKTTTTRMIAAVLDAAGRSCGIIGTVGAELDERRWPLEHTTPLPPELHAILAEMREAGAHSVAIEVSSHALALDRVEDVHFAVAALTNVTRDHLDFHQTVESYAAAKRRLFSMTAAAVLNLDDAHGRQWHNDITARVPTVTYAIDADADVHPRALTIAPDGSRFTLGGAAFEVKLPGRFNVANALAAIGVARTLGIDDATAARGLASVLRVPGRMEHIRGAGIDVVIDYAHTPDALANALGALREAASGKLALVFGCGGDRDRGKRPEMGAVATAADRIYITSDNPRSEDPQAIVDDILPGMGSHPYVVELDRRTAIARAIAEASPGDVVLIAGKGHETSQLIGDRVLPFNDAAVAREVLQR
ncbi:MAG: UDP-N-acetylmuramoyl-L-alanyl-D-glutamate--2,6-diaminopimelate ligase [Vulcanimicrobiaceae bacterium]